MFESLSHLAFVSSAFRFARARAPRPAQKRRASVLLVLSVSARPRTSRACSGPPWLPLAAESSLAICSVTLCTQIKLDLGGPPAWRQIGRNVFRQEHAFREDSVLGIGHGFPRIAPGGFNFSDSGFNHIPFDCS